MFIALWMLSNIRIRCRAFIDGNSTGVSHTSSQVFLNNLSFNCPYLASDPSKPYGVQLRPHFGTAWRTLSAYRAWGAKSKPVSRLWLTRKISILRLRLTGYRASTQSCARPTLIAMSLGYER